MPLSKYAILIAILSFIGPSCLCQTAYTSTRYDKQNGLPSNSIKGMAYDSSSGMLWIASEGGLTRFDGYRFYNIALQLNKNPGTRIFALVKGPKDSIYLFADGSRLYVIRNGRPTLLDSSHGKIIGEIDFRERPALQSGKPITDNKYPWLLPDWIAADTTTDQRRCFFVKDGQAWLYERNSDKYTSLGKVPDHARPFIMGSVFFLQIGATIFRLREDPDRLEQQGLAGIAAIDTILPRVLSKILQQPGNRFFITKNKIWNLRVTETGLGMSPITEDVEPQTEASCIVQIGHQPLYVIGSATEGILILKRTIVTTKRPNRLGPGESVVSYPQMELGPDTVVSYREALMTPTDAQPYNNTGIGATIHFLKDSKGIVWYFANDTVYAYDHSINKSTRYVLSDNSGKVAFAETSRGIVCATDHGVFVLQDDRFKKIAFNPDYFWDVSDVLVMDDSTILIAVTKGYVACNIYTARQTLSPIDPLARVRTFWKYKEYVFMGTYGQGILVSKNGLVKRIPLDGAKNLLFAHCFVPDGKGFCFISSNNGIFKASIAALVAAYEKDLSYIYYHYIGSSDGLGRTELNGGCHPCALRLHSGVMSFPSLDGLKWLEPDPITLPPSGQVSFDEARAGDSAYGELGQLAFPPDVQQLVFRFSVPYWGNPENLYCFYRLRGYDEEWHPFKPTELSSVLYTNLAHGQYVLEIKVVTGFEPGREKISALPFSIGKPWYLKWWFLLVCTLAIVALVAWVIHLRTGYLLRKSVLLQQKIDQQTDSLANQKKQLLLQVATLQAYQADLEESNRFKNRLISIIGHDIITPLRFLKSLGTSVVKKKGTMPPETMERIGLSIATSAHDMETMSLNMLNWVKVQPQGAPLEATVFAPYDVVAMTLSIFKEVLLAKGLTANNQIAPSVSIKQFLEPVRIILHNIIMNAKRYSDKGTITIDSSVSDNGWLTIDIADQGRGMTKKQVEQLMQPTNQHVYEGTGHGLGFQIIRDMLRITGGTIQIDSEMEKGTIVRVSLPSI